MRGRRSTSFADLMLESAPTSYWRMGELNGTVARDSFGANHGTYTGGYTLGVAGALAGDGDRAVTLNGTTGYVSVPHNATLNRANGPFSIVARIKRAATGVNYGILSKGSGAYYFRVRSDNVLNMVRSGQSDVANANTTLPADTNWHHVVVTYAGSNGAISFYQDGATVDVTATPTANFTDNTTALSIGQDSGADFLSGSVDEVAFYNRVLTAAEIMAFYTTGLGR